MNSTTSTDVPLTNSTLDSSNRTPNANNELLLVMAAVSTILDALGVFTSIAFISIAIRGISKQRLSPKLYLFLLNRALADLFMGSGKFPGHLGDLLPSYRDSTLVIYSKYMGDKVFLISFYTATATLCALSVLKFISISKPLVYKRRVTIFKCILVLVIIWLLILFLILTLVAVFEGNHCRKGPSPSCMKLVVWIKAFLACLLTCFYLSNIICYCLVTWMLAWRQKAQSRQLMRASGKRKTAFINIWLNFLNFTACYMPYLLFRSFEAAVLSAEGLQQSVISKTCHNLATFIIYGFTYVRIIIDNLIPFKTDESFRKIAMWESDKPDRRSSTMRNYSMMSVPDSRQCDRERDSFLSSELHFDRERQQCHSPHTPPSAAVSHRSLSLAVSLDHHSPHQKHYPEYHANPTQGSNRASPAFNRRQVVRQGTRRSTDHERELTGNVQRNSQGSFRHARVNSSDRRLFDSSAEEGTGDDTAHSYQQIQLTEMSGGGEGRRPHVVYSMLT